ncbi:MAG: GGDEF domain-containing protein [Acidobacteriota bacterium]|jgi:diguanylate cyclase (GGDEF)-like protein|nr:GGDEF domain-containing protein [Acidobacteriota bacterium]
MTRKNSNDLRLLLDSSIESQLISTSLTALKIIDVDAFESYNIMSDIENDMEAYSRILDQLRNIQSATKVKYIYALKQLNDGQYYFVFDTDPEDDTVLEVAGPYKLETVHEQAFLGKQSFDMNMSDEWGRYHTSAVPIRKNGKVIGIVCTDLDNTLWARSNESASDNFKYLLTSVGFIMLLVLLLTSVLLRRLQTVQDELFQMANFDAVTGLPNRRYLMDCLKKISRKNGNAEPYALLLIDLDNFKAVNDNAGHDAGDALLRHIAAYLESTFENSRSFRPAAGVLNVSARIGGDEFVQIIPGVATETDAAIAAQKLLDNFSSQMLDRYIEKYHVGMSIGVALYPLHSDDFHVLIKYADIAMYHAKESGKNAYRVYEDEMHMN